MNDLTDFLWVAVETELLPQFRFESQTEKRVWLVWFDNESNQIEHDSLSPDEFRGDDFFPAQLKAVVAKDIGGTHFPVVCVVGDVAQLRWFRIKPADGIPAYRQKTKAAIAERLASLRRSEKPWMG